MTTTPDASPQTVDLQFDRAEQQDGNGAASDQPLLCSKCQRSITTEYFQVGDAVACDECRAAVVRAQQAAAARGRRASGLARGLLFGVGAALAGAAIYYAVIAITEWELAIVALLIGWMVGWAVRRGSGGVGGRRYQVTALVLTYLSVGMAYTPVAFKALMAAQKNGPGAGSAQLLAPAKPPTSTAATAAAPTSSATTAARTSPVAPTSSAAPTPPAATTPSASPAPAASASAPASAPATASPASTAAEAPAARGAQVPGRTAGKRDVPPAPAGPVLWGAIALALLAALVASLVLPILIVVGTLPSGILSAVIIGVGMRQAWKMTAALAVPVSGPYRVGSVVGASQA